MTSFLYIDYNPLVYMFLIEAVLGTLWCVPESFVEKVRDSFLEEDIVIPISCIALVITIYNVLD